MLLSFNDKSLENRKNRQNLFTDLEITSKNILKEILINIVP
jgi:hypothetical protein